MTVEVDDGSRIHADDILVATGGRAAVHDLGLEKVGVEPDGPIHVDTSMRAIPVPEAPVVTSPPTSIRTTR